MEFAIFRHHRRSTADAMPPAFRSRRLRVARAISVIMMASALATVAQDQAGQKWFVANGDSAWLRTYDSTLIGRRVDSEFSFERDTGNKSTTEIDTSVRDGWGLAKNLAFGLQAELPIKWVDTGGVIASGVADLETRAGFVHRIFPGLRWGAALNLKFPTASNPALQDAFEMRPILAVSWDATKWMNFGVNAAYSITPSTTGSDAVSKLELKFPVAVEFSRDWSAALTYKPTWDYAGDSTYHKMELDVTRLFGASRQFAVSPGIEVPLSPQSLEYKLLVDVVWNF